MGQSILLADDEAPSRELLSLFFRKKGLEVAAAITAEEAKEMAAKVPFALAILDVKLASENGLELLRVLKYHQPCVPILILSNLPDDSLADEVRAAGVDGFRRKTDPFGTIYDEVRRHLPGRKELS